MIWFNQGPILQEEAVSHEFQIIIIINLAKTFKVGEALADNKMRLSHHVPIWRSNAGVQ